MPAEVEHGELVDVASSTTATVEVVDDDPTESVTEPGKVMRIGSMVKQLLEEVRQAPLDEASRERLAEIYERSIVEVSGALSPDLQEELHSLALPFRPDVVPSEAEIRVAKAQLVGWLEGCSTGSRPRCSPSRSPPASSSSNSASSPAPPAPAARLVSDQARATVPAHICSGPEHC